MTALHRRASTSSVGQRSALHPLSRARLSRARRRTGRMRRSLQRARQALPRQPDRVVSRGIDQSRKRNSSTSCPARARTRSRRSAATCAARSARTGRSPSGRRTADARRARGREPTELVCPQLAAAAGAVLGEEITPDEIVERAVASGCRSIAYTYTEPTVFYELAHDTAVRARARGLRGCVRDEQLRRGAAARDRDRARRGQRGPQVLRSGELPAHQPRPARSRSRTPSPLSATRWASGSR